MDINLAISLLSTESQNLGANVNKQLQLQTALDLAIQQLKGTLVTQLKDLEDAKTTIATLQTVQAAPSKDATPA